MLNWRSRDSRNKLKRLRRPVEWLLKGEPTEESTEETETQKKRRKSKKERSRSM